MSIFDSWRDIIARDLNWNNGSDTSSWSERTFDKLGVYDYVTQRKPMLTDQVQTFKEGGKQIAKSWKAAGEERAGFGDDIVRGTNWLASGAGQQIGRLDQHAQKHILDVNGSAEQAAWLVGNVMRGANYASEKTGDAAGWLAKETGLVDEDAAKFLGSFVPDLLVAGAGKTGLLTKGAKSLNRASKAALGEDILGAARRANVPKKGLIRKGIDDIAGGIKDATAPVGVTDTGIVAKIPNNTLDLEKLSAKPLQVGHKMERSTRIDNLQGLVEGGAPKSQIVDYLKSGPAGYIDDVNLAINAEELANQPELLKKLFVREKNIKKLQENYYKKLAQSQADPGSARKGAATANAQRAWYDEVANNLFEHEMLIYGKDKPRKLVAHLTKWATRDEWHHIFGNKEAGEFFMSLAAQDPLVVVNLMKRMQKLKLSSSGIAKNIAIMKKTGHNNFHKWLKEMGFESVAGKQAPLAFDQFGQEISKVATEGYVTRYSKTGKLLKKPKKMPADPGVINQLFEMVDYYAEANKFLRKKLKAGRVTMEDGTILSLKAGKIEKSPEVMSELKSKKVSGFGDVLRSGELMKAHKNPGRVRSEELMIR